MEWKHTKKLSEVIEMDNNEMDKKFKIPLLVMVWAVAIGIVAVVVIFWAVNFSAPIHK